MTSVCPSVTLVVCGHIIVKKWKTAYDSLHRTSCDMLFLGLTRVFPKWHLDQFSRFCMALQCDQHTDRQTHRPRISDQQEISNNLGRGCVALPFHCAAHPHKNAPPVGKLCPHLLRRTLGITDPPPRTASRSTQPFLQNTRSLPMDRQTDRQIVRTRNSACTNNCCASSTVYAAMRLTTGS